MNLNVLAWLCNKLEIKSHKSWILISQKVWKPFLESFIQSQSLFLHIYAAWCSDIISKSAKSTRCEQSTVSAPDAEMKLLRVSETSPVWCARKNVLRLNKCTSCQESAVMSWVANPRLRPCVNGVEYFWRYKTEKKTNHLR